MTQPSENCNNPDCQRIDMTMRQASEWSRKQDEGGAWFERGRIIALLEFEWWMRPSNKARLIALIKGDETRIVQDNDATYIKGGDK